MSLETCLGSEGTLFETQRRPRMPSGRRLTGRSESKYRRLLAAPDPRHSHHRIALAPSRPERPCRRLCSRLCDQAEE